MEARHLNQSVKSTVCRWWHKPLACEHVVHKPEAYATFESVQWESNPHFRHGKAVGYRYIMDACLFQFSIQYIESIGRDSNPRHRITKPGYWPLYDRCVFRFSTSAFFTSEFFKKVGPEGFEPSPIWLRARHAANNTSDPRLYFLVVHIRHLVISRAGGIRTPTKHFKRVLCYR